MSYCKLFEIQYCENKALARMCLLASRKSYVVIIFHLNCCNRTEEPFKSQAATYANHPTNGAK